MPQGDSMWVTSIRPVRREGPAVDVLSWQCVILAIVFSV